MDVIEDTKSKVSSSTLMRRQPAGLPIANPLSPARRLTGGTPRRKVVSRFSCTKATIIQFALVFVMVVLPNLLLIWFLGVRDRQVSAGASSLAPLVHDVHREVPFPHEMAGQPQEKPPVAALSAHDAVSKEDKTDADVREMPAANSPRKGDPPTAARPLVDAKTESYVVTSHRERSDLQKYLNRIQKPSFWSLSNLCYNSTNQKFVVARAAWAELPLHFRENKQVQQDVPDKIPESSVGKWITGTTVIGREMHLDQTGAHFYFFMLPVTSLINYALQQKPSTDIYVAFDKFEIPKEHTLESQFGEIVLKDVPLNRRISLASLKDELICFSDVLSVGIDYSATIHDPKDLDYLKSNAGKVEMQEFVEDCASPRANKAAVGILNRRVYSRKVENIHQLKVATKQVFGDSVEIIVFDSPNVACEGTPCLGYTDCTLFLKGDTSELKKTCRTSRAVGDDIRVFNNLTFLISVHGAANMNYVWLPHGAHVVEIFPFAISDYTYKQISDVSEIEYTAFQDQNRTLFDSKFPDMKEGSECWKNNECRKFMKEAAVHVTMDGPDGLKRILYQQMSKWKDRCKI